jgi:predicted dienelactone hydrolase
MGKHDADFSPLTFAVWYECAARINAKLSHAIEKCRRAEQFAIPLPRCTLDLAVSAAKSCRERVSATSVRDRRTRMASLP